MGIGRMPPIGQQRVKPAEPVVADVPPSAAAFRPCRWWRVFLAVSVGLLLMGASACGKDELSQQIGDYEEFEGHVKYTVNTEPNLTDLTFYQGGGSHRLDIDSDEGLVALVHTRDAFYVCSEKGWGDLLKRNQCANFVTDLAAAMMIAFSESSLQDPVGQAIALEMLLDPFWIELYVFGDTDYNVTREEIAGIAATCFTTDGNEACFTQEGSLLRATWSERAALPCCDGARRPFERALTFEAVETRADIPDGAFEPPFAVNELGDFGQ